MVLLSTQFRNFWNSLKTNKIGKANGLATLDENGRIPYSQLAESAMTFEGKWDASTNTPTLTQGGGVKGSFYIVSVAGTWEEMDFNKDDRVIFDGENWVQLPAGAVTSVNGLVGPVMLTAEDIEMNELNHTKVYDAISELLSAKGNIVYKTYNTYQEFMAQEDFSSLPNGIYLYVIAQDTNYPRTESTNYYTTIYAYMAYKDESTSGIEDWDQYEWDTETVQAQADMDGTYFLTDNFATGGTATASSGTGRNAVDGSLTSRWESTQSDPQWLAVDMGQKQIIESIGILWETASAATYEIQFSNDGETWTTVQKCSGSAIQIKEYKKITLQHASKVRYIRIYGETRTTQYGYSIYELGFYGKAATGTVQFVGKLKTDFTKIGKVIDTSIATQDRSYFLAVTKSAGGTEQEIENTQTVSYNPVSGNLSFAGTMGQVANFSSNGMSLVNRYGQTQNITGFQSIFDIVHPVGEIYIQYPTQKEPEELYNNNSISSTWEDITSTYAGLFFRAEGGSSAGFGASAVVVQQEGLPNITGTMKGATGTYTGAFTETSTVAGSYGGSTTNFKTVNFSAKNGNSQVPDGTSVSTARIYGNSAHVTPVNTAIRIWKRTY